jgi:hypothetical protein
MVRSVFHITRSKTGHRPPFCAAALAPRSIEWNDVGDRVTVREGDHSHAFRFTAGQPDRRSSHLGGDEGLRMPK